jgi:hypothetical protein
MKFWFFWRNKKGKNSNANGTKRCFWKKKKNTKVTTFLRKENRHCGDRKENTLQKGIFKKRFIFGKFGPNSPHFEERNSEAAIFRHSRLLREVAKTK